MAYGFHAFLSRMPSGKPERECRKARAVLNVDDWKYRKKHHERECRKAGSRLIQRIQSEEKDVR